MLAHVAIFLAAAVIAVPLFKRLGLGSVIGYLAAGAVIGPSGFALIDDVEDTMHFAELGVVLLLFIIGLELQPSRLWRLRHMVFGMGAAQVFGTAAVLAGAAMAFGVAWPAAIVIGIALAMSSTAFATQILGEKRELGTPHGRAAFSVLLFQDLAAIPVLALVPLLGASPSEAPSAEPAQPAWVQYGLALAVIVGLVVAGRLFLRPLLRIVAGAKSHELSVATALLVVLGTAMLMEKVELSMALGAFIAGVLLADSEYRHDLEANIEPFKGLLLGLFFIAVGMSADLGLFAREPLVILGLVLGLVALKLAVLVAVGIAFGHPRPSALGLGVAVSQGGEFAFVIFGAAIGAGVLAPEMGQRLVVVVTLSMVLTPLLFLARDALLRRAEAGEVRPFDEIVDADGQVIIAGFGRFGQIVARLLRLKKIPFTALDASAEHVDFVRRFGNKIHYGDASRLDLLRAAKAENARVLVLAIDDFDQSMRTLETVQRHFPHLAIVARARNRQHAYALLGAGVTHVIRETFAASVDAGRLALVELGLSPQEAASVAERFAAYDEDMVRATAALRDDQEALQESAKRYAAELERIFEDDLRADAAAEPVAAPVVAER